MARQQKSLFDSNGMTLKESKALALEGLREKRRHYDHWRIAYSGGKDSHALLSLVVDFIQSGLLTAPETLEVFYADTRMELPPLHLSAMSTLARCEQMGIKTRILLPKLDHRMFVYILGLGVPPPHNTFRWCTPKLKVNAMEELIRIQFCELNRLPVLSKKAIATAATMGDLAGTKRILMLTGVRLGESAARDARIVASCSKTAGECGQGYYQNLQSPCHATFGPITHFRVCHVWDVNMESERLPGQEVSTVYGMGADPNQEAPELRSDCFGCDLIQKDWALERAIELEGWGHLSPLRQLRPLKQRLKLPKNRLRKNGEVTKSGKLSAKQMRLGPIIPEVRVWAREQVIAIESEVNEMAAQTGRPIISLINPEEDARILELIAAGAWPRGWSGDEPRGDLILDQILATGDVQRDLFAGQTLSCGCSGS